MDTGVKIAASKITLASALALLLGTDLTACGAEPSEAVPPPMVFGAIAHEFDRFQPSVAWLEPKKSKTHLQPHNDRVDGLPDSSPRPIHPDDSEHLSIIRQEIQHPLTGPASEVIR